MSEDSLERKIRQARRRGWKPDLSAMLRAYDLGMAREAAAMFVQYGFATPDEAHKMLQDKRVCLDVRGNAEPVESKPMSDNVLDNHTQYVKVNKEFLWDDVEQ